VPNVNIEQIVARPCALWKLGGFHFNDSKYGDDDVDTGSVEPFRLFLVFNELIDAGMREAEGFGGRRHRADRDLSRLGLSQAQSRGATADGEDVGGDRLRKQAPRMAPQYLRRETPPSERRSPNARFAPKAVLQ
jgi:hypothetical protein